jgi:Protein of unknown function (DUF1778)
MVKSEVIIVRVGPETKGQIEQAAERKGLSLTTFVVDAAKKAAEKTNAEPPVARFRGIPAWFRAVCTEASQGGSWTYRYVGEHLARHLGGMIPQNVNDVQEWATILKELEDLVFKPPVKRDNDAIWAWLYKYFPKCMELVPKRRRLQFLEGFCKRIEV